jgi:hypothetical protein
MECQPRLWIEKAWTTHESDRLVAPAAGARMASWDIEHSRALGRCLVHKPYHLVEPGTGQQEGVPRQAHNRSGEVMVDHHCFDSLVLEAAAHRPARPEDQHEKRVLAHRQLSAERPPLSFVLSILCEFP